MTYTLQIIKEISSDEIVDLCDLLDGRISPWLIATESDIDAGEMSINYYVNANDPSEGAVTTTITFQNLLDALAALHAEDQLCCAAAMVDDELGAGCAADADLVFQRVVLGAIIYG